MTDSSALPQQAASPAQALFPDLAQEFSITRRVLERVPSDRLDWQPHAKSMTLGRLASHLAELPSFGAMIASTDGLDWATYEYKAAELNSSEEMVAHFDRVAAEMTGVIEAASWSSLGQHWVMRSGPAVILEGEKGTLLRTLGMSHMVHHRAQLGVYLRLLGVPVPGVYGPSADEM